MSPCGSVCSDRSRFATLPAGSCMSARRRGEAYLDFARATFALDERVRLAELRAVALETRTDAALRLGEAATLISELESRIRRVPYRERSWEQLITALYRSGRQSDALAV